MTPAAIPPPIVPLLAFVAGTAAPLGVALDVLLSVATEVEEVLAIGKEEVVLSDASN